MEEKTKRVASALARRGFGQGDFVYFITYDFVDLEVLQLAVWMLGGVTRGGTPKGVASMKNLMILINKVAKITLIKMILQGK